ncbi:hypothetical protein [Acinetobacter phage Ab69]|nr:hypothetical protein [Acinetobacter phage Ab69]
MPVFYFYFRAYRSFSSGVAQAKARFPAVKPQRPLSVELSSKFPFTFVFSHRLQQTKQ